MCPRFGFAQALDALMHSPAFFWEALGKFREDGLHKSLGQAQRFLSLLYVGIVRRPRIPEAHRVFRQHCDARDG